jgi:hypothetical protein
MWQATYHAVPHVLLPPACPFITPAAGKPFSVLSFGSSNYRKFAAAADLLHSSMLSAGAAALLPPAKADALMGEEGVVWPWLRQLAAVMREQG